MPSSNFVVSSLPAYVQDNRDLLLKNFGLTGAGTRQHIGLQTGIKSSAYLNYLDVDPVLQDGVGCGFNASGTATLSQRTISVKTIKINMDICPDSLLGKYPEYLVKIGASNPSLPFEQYVVDGIIASINDKIERLIWQGDDSSSDSDIRWFDGFITQFAADSDVVDVALAAGTSAYDGILRVYLNLSAYTLKRGGVIFVSPEIFRLFMVDMVNKNFYHYAGPVNEAPKEFVFPGTNVRVIEAAGLAGNLNIVGTFADNLVYGTDLESDDEDIKIWFSDDDDLFKLKVRWNSGVAYHFPAEVVLGTFAAAPTYAGSAVTINQATINQATINEAAA